MAKKSRVMGIKAIKDRKYHSLRALDQKWIDMFGNLERNFKMTIVGPSTSGKSSLALQFADQLAKRIGKVLYNSWEEGLNQTIQSRINERNISAARLYIADRMPFEELVDKIKRNYYRVVIIDSVKFMGFTYEQYKLLTEIYKTKSFIFLAHGTSHYSTDGANDIVRAADVKVFVKNGVATIISRYKSDPVEVKLFDYNPKAKNGQIGLFQKGGSYE